MSIRTDFIIALLVASPLLAALVLPFVWRIARSATGWIAAIVPSAAFVYFVALLPTVSTGEPVLARLTWIESLGLDLSFRIDGLSLLFALAITGIGSLILIYSGAYLRGHPHQGRFLAFLAAFTGAMLGLVLADNVVVLFVFWELTTITSFLLIGFDHSRQAARRGAIQALVVTNIGGLSLLVLGLLLNALSGEWNLSAILAMGPLGTSLEYGWLLLLTLLAAFTKSAQLPFHFWLPNAMEAPTPVSAFLHSATMVQGGVYLLARLHPLLGDTVPWTVILVTFGSVTLLWGSLGAMRQTDLKQVLAQTTIASLGLLVLMLGIGTELAVTAAIVYFAAHALYKAALFLLVGALDHGTGTRDLTQLSGLARAMPVTALATFLAAASMLGMPLTLGFVAKEELYYGLLGGTSAEIVALLVALAGNAILGGVALTVAIRPFLGPATTTPRPAHEAGPSMLFGPLLLAVGGGLLVLFASWSGQALLGPAVAAVAGAPVALHLSAAIHIESPAFWLSVITWLLSALAFITMERARGALRRGEAAIGWNFDRGFDAVMFGLIRMSAAVTRVLHHGRLEIYLVLVFVLFAAAVTIPVVTMNALPRLLAWPDLTFYEWGTVVLAVVGVLALAFARSRLTAIVILGVQGLAVSLIYLQFGAPDLAFTQLMVEVLSVVILALVMTRLNLEPVDMRELEDLLRDGTLALICGVGLTVLLFVLLATPIDTRLAEFFTAYSVAVAHGRNIVNVILVDFRGLDTLGEIAVVMTAGIAILALLRGATRPRPVSAPTTPARRKRRTRNPPPPADTAPAPEAAP